MTGCYWHQDWGIPRSLQHAQSSEWLHTAENSKHVLFRSSSRDCFTQNKRTWEPGLWSNFSHSWMIPLTPYRFVVFFAVLFLHREWQGHSCKWGSREGRGRKLWNFSTKKRGVLCWPLWKQFRIPGLLAGLRWDAEHSPLLLLAAGRPSSWHPARQQLPASWGCGSTSHVETLCSPPGRAQESQCPMPGLASTPETNHFQLRTKPNRSQPPGLCSSVGKMT